MLVLTTRLLKQSSEWKQPCIQSVNRTSETMKYDPFRGKDSFKVKLKDLKSCIIKPLVSSEGAVLYTV